MTVQPADIYKQLRAAREDLTKLQGRVTDILNMLNELQLPDIEWPRCPDCGIRCRGLLTLAEHVYVSHDGPVPDHYLAAEKAAGLT